MKFRRTTPPSYSRKGLESGPTLFCLVWGLDVHGERLKLGRYVALLRAVNLGKVNRISMPVLREMLRESGFQSVTSYLQSGNLALGSDMAESEVKAAIQAVISDVFQLEIPVAVRSATAICELAASDPFDLHPADRERLHVTFLSGEVDPDRVRSYVKPAPRSDEFLIVGNDVFIYCHGPYHLTNLGNAFWEKVSNGHATTRNWSTVAKLAAIAAG